MLRDLGCTNSIDVIEDLVALAGRTVLDIGCGGLEFTRLLAERGARTLGIDPDPLQAERNRAAHPVAGLEFVEADATSLPVADDSVDGVFFSFSLHHVPADAYPEVFAEVRRVLMPKGFLCVIEPAGGALYDEVLKLFHDEDHVRAEAQRALHQLAVPLFETRTIVRYHSSIDFDSFDTFATRYGGKTFNTDYTEADIRRPEVESAFERLGAPDYRFELPKIMMFLQGLKTA